MKKIVIKNIAMPTSSDPDSIIRWMCEAFGFSGDATGDNIDLDILRIFTSEYGRRGVKGISSSEIKVDQNVARSTIIYHLNRFIEAGLVVKRGRKYYLRAPELSRAIEEIEYDIEREMHRMLDMAREFDRMMNSPSGRVKRNREAIDLNYKDVKIE
ncbi:MAG: winged helix-turn-helix domain-containing protein [Candidatus Marsarchaeota archaeon]|nr:winged helix-turn-helix domain-containing protein [Candidatus Marsarchaeota archaeon]